MTIASKCSFSVHYDDDITAEYNNMMQIIKNKKIKRGGIETALLLAQKTDEIVEISKRFVTIFRAHNTRSVTVQCMAA